MADDVDDEDGGWLVRREDGDDLWEPTDDPDFWDSSTGERAYQGNETALRWRVIRADGTEAARGFPTRAEAFRQLSNYIPPTTIRRLENLNRETAGWSKITADGWTIEPIPEKKSDG